MLQAWIRLPFLFALQAYILFCTPLWVFAQDPTYAVIGEQEFANTDIYSIYQDKKESLFVGTNRGLYAYNNGAFKLFAFCENQIGNSIFQVQEDKKGEIYCCNLSGQIFRVRGEKLELFYQVKKEDIGAQFYFFFDSKNDLVIVSKQIIRISKNIAEVLYRPKKSTEIYYLQQINEDKYSIYSDTSSKLLYYQADSVIITDVSLPQSPENGGVVQVGYLNGIKILKTVQNDLIPVSDKIVNTVKNIGHERYCQLDENLVLAMTPRQGMRILSIINDTLQASNIVLKNHFISFFAKGGRGTLFLGTFGSGIFVVPNFKIKKTVLPQGMRGIASDGLSDLYLTNKNGTLYRLASGLSPIDSSLYARSLDWVFYSKAIETKDVPNKAYKNLVYDGRTNSALGTIKDVFTANDSLAFLATSRNIYCYAKSPRHALPYFIENLIAGEALRLQKKSQRYNAIAFDTLDQSLYVASNMDVVRFDKEGSKQEILYQGFPIICSDILIKDDLIYLATNDKGILVFKKQRFVKQYNFLAATNTANKLISYKNYIFILSPNRLYVLDTKTQKMKLLGFADGLVNSAISDFTVADNALKLLYKDALVSFPIDNINFNAPALPFRMDSMLVNGKKIDLEKVKNFNYMQNKIAFYFNFPSIEYMDNAYYLYQIKELGGAWQRTSVKNGVVEYPALPPGTYTFSIKVAYDIYESEEQLISFVIYAPFWQRWWFYLFSTLAVAAIIATFYSFRIRQIKKLNEVQLKKQLVEKELADSQLKALRSQMNPHFIFNSLNAIQDLILQQDTDNSYDYVVLFAELVRNTLNYSNKDFIPIEKEIEFLEVYLSLEKLRFKEELDYEIISDCNQDIEVPSLLVQPFIENALLHGLLHKHGKKYLSVRFSYQDESLTCTITDNGVGRKKSEEINKRKGNRHASFSLEAMENRMRILANRQDIKAGYEVTDLEENGLAAGTKVLIRMPFRRMY